LLKRLLAAIGAANKNLPMGMENYFERTHEFEDGPLPPFAINNSLDHFLFMEKFVQKTMHHMSI